MNNIFKIIWNKTTQRLEVVSELAKGAVKASSSTQTKTVITKQLFKLTVLSVCLNYSNLSIAAEKIIVNGINFNDKLIAIGGDGGDDRNQKGVQVGNYAGIPGNKQIAIGHDHIVAAGNNSILIGSNYNSRPGGTTGVNTIAIGPGAQAIGRNTLTLGANSGSGSGYNGYDDAVFLGSHSRISSKGQGQTQTDEELKALEKTYTDAVVTYNKSGTDTNLNKVIAAGKAINNVALNKVDAMTIKSNSNTNNKFNVTESTITPLNESKDKTTVSILSIGGENGDNKMYRQIQNVAAGRMSADSFDAVNGSQLYYVRNYTGWNIGHNSNNQETVTGRVNNDHTVIFKANDNYVNVSTTLDSTNKSTVNIGVNTSDISVTKDNGRITAVAANNPTNTVETNTVATATSVRTALNAFNEVKADKNTKFTINAGNDKVKDLTLGNDGTVNFKAEDGLEVEAKNDAVVYKLNAESKQSIADAKAAATTVTNKLNEINQSVKRAETAAGKAEAAKTAAETAKAGAESAKTAAVTAQGKAEAAQGKAEAAQGKAESARDEAITAKDAAVTAQGEAEKAQGKAESARDEAITAKD
ncbi:ESPR-type extended signal peptide-containing protein, partial [Haemophilus parainfluenzae]